MRALPENPYSLTSQVVLFTPGEISAANYGAYLTNATITGLFAQEIKGAVVMVERR